MNIVVLILAILAGSFQFGEETARTHAPNAGMCITADKIIRPVRGWKVVKTAFQRQGKEVFMEVIVHNPMNAKTPESIDAKFVFAADPSAPNDPQKYNLVKAFYYNKDTNVLFKRIYTPETVNKTEKLSMQTPCFAREVLQVINFAPEEVKVPEKGTK